MVSGDQIAGPGLIEPENWIKLVFLDMPKCHICGMPFDIIHDVQNAYDLVECAACIARRPAYDRARAVFKYDDVSRQIVFRLKNSGDRTGLKQMGRWFGQISQDLIDDADIIMAVPLHTARLRSRGYNQSLWLASSIAKMYGKKLSYHMLKRRRNTPSQAGKSVSGRFKNVKGAFYVPNRHRKTLKGKRVLLVDDVFTTGATVEACAKVLMRSGVAAVDVITLTRVVTSVDPTI